MKFHDIERREGLYETMKHMYEHCTFARNENRDDAHRRLFRQSARIRAMELCSKTFGTIAEIAAPLGAYLANETGPEEAPVLKAFLDDVASPAAAVNFDRPIL